jgi:hypothetical protein
MSLRAAAVLQRARDRICGQPAGCFTCGKKRGRQAQLDGTKSSTRAPARRQRLDRFVQPRRAQVAAVEERLHQVGTNQDRTSQHDLCELGTEQPRRRQIRRGQVGTIELRLVEIGPDEPGTTQIRAVQLREDEVRRRGWQDA